MDPIESFENGEDSAALRNDKNAKTGALLFPSGSLAISQLVVNNESQVNLSSDEARKLYELLDEYYSEN